MTQAELRIAVAEELGWRYHGSAGDKLIMRPPNHGDASPPPDWPNDCNDAHTLLVELRRMGFRLFIENVDDQWRVEAENPAVFNPLRGTNDATDPSLVVAICKVFLKASRQSRIPTSRQSTPEGASPQSVEAPSNTPAP